MWCAFEGRRGSCVCTAAARSSTSTIQLVAGLFDDIPGARAVILVHADRISDSCGYSVPLYEFQGHRSKLVEWADHRDPRTSWPTGPRRTRCRSTACRRSDHPSACCTRVFRAGGPRTRHSDARGTRMGSGMVAGVSDLTQCTATELLAMYADGTASPVEATQAVLERIEAAEPDAQRVLPRRRRRGAGVGARRARSAGSASEPVGPLDGVPTSIKDLILTKGWPTLPRQPHRRPRPGVGRRCAGDGPAARGGRGAARQDDDARVRLQGRDQLRPDRHHAQPVGSDEDARADRRAARRPPSRPASARSRVGTDGAGSVRIPAAFCGNVGLKPSFGRVPAYPLSPFGTVSHLGPHTMSVADAALMLNVLQQPDARDWTSLPPDRRRLPRRSRRRRRRAAHRLLADARLRRRCDPEVAAAVPRAAAGPRRGRAPSSRPSTPASTTRSRSRPGCGSPARGRCGTR